MNFYDYLSFVYGAVSTIGVSFIAIIVGIPLGLGLALLRWAKVPLLGKCAYVYVSLVRSCPAVTLIMLIYFGLPQFEISLSPLVAAMISFSITATAFNCEIWRSALLSFDRSQYEAAQAFGMNRWIRFRYVLLPQVWRSSIPGLINEMTLLVKNSPAISVIGLLDITRAAQRIGARTYEPIPPLLVGFAIYIVIVMLLIKLQKHLEVRIRSAQEPL
ncbi:amino acid ABC transporter permease [Marinobacterium lutimaris]|uniref:Amino acid ABC transporter membrane protein 1, PAAT family n=1 Tax=Marinobacterium lutimaris TaxID=568106 RepID=A0A1H6D6H3_9GAMM|nr:amino acid ABC transporter permease [Marinobacterium lutimaris]SEG80950.1 amino acid ABC transporter membrane protein 1, PAAT family [Marinobacterium lutimaris]